MKLTKSVITLSISTLISLSAFANPNNFDNDSFKVSVASYGSNIVQEISPNASLDWTNGVVKVTGAGAPPDRGNFGQRRIMALRAAKADAYRQLLEAINGVHVDAETIVKDFVTESDIIKTKVQGIVKGAKQVGEPRYMSDGSVEIDLEIKLFGKKSSVASVIRPQENRNKNVTVTEVKPSPVSDSYTGLIVDLRNLGGEPAMSPSISDEDGGEVYIGGLPIDPDYVINTGIVGFTNSMSEAKRMERAGENPLIIRALKVKGLFKADVVISNKDAEKILGANETNSFLADAKVVFVL